MTSLFGVGTILAGLAAIAGVLYLLQRLRVRHRPVQVISTLFWRAAVEEARARVLVERFRHPLVYLFLLAICALLWLAAAGLDGTDPDGRRHVVLIEGAAGAGATEASLERTLAAVADHVAELPRERRQVILCAGTARTLLAPGEPARLLRVRIADGILPARGPSTVAETLASLGGTLDARGGTTVWLAGSARLPALPLPANVDLAAVDVEPTSPAANVAITACGVSPAASGAWDRVDLLVEARAEGASSASIALAMTLDGTPLAEGAERTALASADSRPGARFVVRDVPARGQRLEARVVGEADANPLDDAVTRILPTRRLLRVAVSPSLAPWLTPVLSADPAVRLVTSGSGEGSADVAVRLSGESIGGDVPALTFLPQDAQEESILLSHAGDEDSAVILSRALLDLGLDQVDAMELAEATGSPITLGARPAVRREIGVWQELLAEEYNFVSSRSFPLFVALAIRWILEVDDFPAEIAAGRPIPAIGPLRSSGAEASNSSAATLDPGVTLDPVGGALVVPTAGEYLTADGAPIAVALLAPVSSVAGGGIAPEAQRAPGGTRPWATLLGLVAAVALAVEWFLLRRGELP